MKILKRGLFAAVALIVLTASMMSFAACGTVTVPAGEYSGSYTCTYQVGDKDKWGVDVTFTIDENNIIWGMTAAAPEGYNYSLGQRPWDASKFTQQFDNKFTVDDIMKIKIKLNDAGYPDGTDCIDSSGMVTNYELNILSGFEASCAMAILAMQNAINSANV